MGGGHSQIARVGLGYRLIPCPLFWGCRYTLRLYPTLKFEISPNGMDDDQKLLPTL
jgi:hypothetical protein